MNKRLLFVFLSIFIPLLQPPLLLSSQIILESEDQFQFARQLMERGEYGQALGELERFIHFFPEDKKVPKARYLIGVCYLEAKEYESARNVFESLHKTYSKTPMAIKAVFMIGESYYRQGALGEAARYFEMVIDGSPEPQLKNAALYRLGWDQMRADRWAEASETFKKVDESNPLFLSSQELSKKSLEGENLPRKDPAAAGALAIVPGLGHVYCNRYRDAAVAFLLNGLTIWAAIEAFDNDLNVLGGILVFLELGWYSGNIYSAVNSAHKHNKKVKNDYRRSLPDHLNLQLFTSREAPLGLVLKIDW